MLVMITGALLHSQFSEKTYVVKAEGEYWIVEVRAKHRPLENSFCPVFVVTWKDNYNELPNWANVSFGPNNSALHKIHTNPLPVINRNLIFGMLYTNQIILDTNVFLKAPEKFNSEDIKELLKSYSAQIYWGDDIASLEEVHRSAEEIFNFEDSSPKIYRPDTILTVTLD